MAQPSTYHVEVMAPGRMPQQRVLGVEDGIATSDVVQRWLQQEYGAGYLSHAGSDVVLLPIGNLRPGSYIYRVHAHVSPVAAPAAAAAADGATYDPQCWQKYMDSVDEWSQKMFAKAVFGPPRPTDYLHSKTKKV